MPSDVHWDSEWFLKLIDVFAHVCTRQRCWWKIKLQNQSRRTQCEFLSANDVNVQRIRCLDLALNVTSHAWWWKLIIFLEMITNNSGGIPECQGVLIDQRHYYEHDSFEISHARKYKFKKFNDFTIWRSKQSLSIGSLGLFGSSCSSVLFCVVWFLLLFWFCWFLVLRFLWCLVLVAPLVAMVPRFRVAPVPFVPHGSLFGSMVAVGSLSSMGSMGSIGSVGSVASISSIGSIGSLGSISSVGSTGCAGSLGDAGFQYYCSQSREDSVSHACFVFRRECFKYGPDPCWPHVSFTNERQSQILHFYANAFPCRFQCLFTIFIGFEKVVGGGLHIWAPGCHFAETWKFQNRSSRTQGGITECQRLIGCNGCDVCASFWRSGCMHENGHLQDH